MKKIGSKSMIQIFALFGFISFLYIYYLSIAFTIKPENQMKVIVPDNDADTPGPKVPRGFLVYGNYCQIPDLDPLAKDVMKLFKQDDYEPCVNYPPLTSIEQNFETDSVRVIFHENLISRYLSIGQFFLECYYQDIMRSGVGNYSDFNYNLSESNYFKVSFNLPSSAEFIFIQCEAKSLYGEKKVIYSNAHPLIRRREEIQKSFDKFKSSTEAERPLSVLMVGIDSISRLNLLRAMPKTAQHLYDTGWFELKGYNKMGDNTFPNVMAILAGYNTSHVKDKCNPYNGLLNDCLFMWDQFQANGYATAYAEDEQFIGTFVYQKLGFKTQPTHYYLRPWGLVAEANLKIQHKSKLSYCLGFQHYAEYIYQYAIDFAETYKKDPFFGLFWTNSFSHNELSDPSAMDDKTKEFLDELQERRVLENSMVVFFSDHGIRFGPVRLLRTGWFEERLPFIFIWLPEWFKQKHPEIVQNLKINRNRLTNPYDLHMTLKHILELSGRAQNLPAAESCPNCQSLFKEIPHNRSCEQISIDPHWCTCKSYENIDKNADVVQEAAKFIVSKINRDLDYAIDKKSYERLCTILMLKSIISSKSSIKLEEQVNFLMVIQVAPSDAIFEATVKFNDKNKEFEVMGTPSRLNAYGNQSSCISGAISKMYCFCME